VFISASGVTLFATAHVLWLMGVARFMIGFYLPSYLFLQAKFHQW
jgi:hypothetical protein